MARGAGEGGMTAEERATEMARKLYDTLASEPEIADFLASAIRAAEDEALEKVAKHCMEQSDSCEAENCDVCAGYVNAAHVARSLKSKPPEGK